MLASAVVELQPEATTAECAHWSVRLAAPMVVEASFDEVGSA